MGMYDVVVFNAASDWTVLSQGFQTKSLEPCVDIYTVTSAGS